VTEKRGAFKGWTVLLAIIAFSMSLLGTFLVRSGVLSSVHAFATDPTRGIFILGFLGVVIGGSLILYAIRVPKMESGGSFTWFSRESMLLVNNVVVVSALGSVLLGTLYPLFMDAMGMGKISVGPPSFNAGFVPLSAPAMFLAGVGPLVRWKQGSLPDLVKRLRIALAVAVATSLVLPLAYGGFNWMASIGIALALWIVFTVLIGFAERLKHEQGSKLAALRNLPRGFWGMQIGHFALAWVVAGIALVSAYESERNVKMNVDDTVVLAGYTFAFKGVEMHDGPNYKAAKGTLEVTKDGKPAFILHPEKRIYNASGMPMTEAAIDYGFSRDVYAALGEELGPNVWTVRVFHKPFVNWLWIAGGLLALGGILAAFDRRYRIALKKTAETVPAKAVVAEGAKA
jgi:cytochrome c-type biogenesis protein CcmF